MAYDTTEAVAKFLSGFQMKITNRERDTVAPDYYVKYSLTLSKGGKDFSTLTAKRTIWKTAGMGLMVTPRKRMPRKRTIEMRSRL